jgi:hypothetical protein
MTGMTEGQRQAVTNNLNSIIEGARRIANDPEATDSDYSYLVTILQRTDSDVWLGITDTLPRSNGERVSL